MSYGTAAAAATPARLRIWLTIGQSFLAFLANFWKILLINFVVPVVLVIVLAFNVHDEPALTDANLSRNALIVVAACLALILYGVVSTAAMQHGIVSYLRNGRFNVGEAMRQGLRRGPALTLVALVLGVMTSIGMVLLVIPFCFVVSIFCVAGTACVVEGTGVFASFSRSAQLTKGNRWRVFWTLSFTMALVFMIGIAGNVVAIILTATNNPITSIIVSGTYSIFTTTFFTVLTVVLYDQLTKFEGTAARVGHNPVL